MFFEQSIKIFLASLKSEKTKDNYIKGIERFCCISKIDNLDEFVQLPTKEIQLVIEDYLLTMRESDHHLHPMQETPSV